MSFSTEIQRFNYLSPIKQNYVSDPQAPLVLVVDGKKMLLMKRYDLLHSFELNLDSKMAFRGLKFGCVIKSASQDDCVKIYFKNTDDVGKFTKAVQGVIRIHENIRPSLDTQQDSLFSASGSLTTPRVHGSYRNESLSESVKESSRRKLDDFLGEDSSAKFPPAKELEFQTAATAPRHITQQSLNEQTQCTAMTLATQLSNSALLDEKNVSIVAKEFAAVLGNFLEGVLRGVMDNMNKMVDQMLEKPKLGRPRSTSSLNMGRSSFPTANVEHKTRKRPSDNKHLLRSHTYWPGFFDGASKPKKSAGQAPPPKQEDIDPKKRLSAINAKSKITSNVLEGMTVNRDRKRKVGRPRKPRNPEKKGRLEDPDKGTDADSESEDGDHDTEKNESETKSDEMRDKSDKENHNDSGNSAERMMLESFRNGSRVPGR